MGDIAPTNSIDIKKELKYLNLYKYQPNGILNISLNRISDMLDGNISVVDPSNPFMYLLETSCMNTTLAVQEYLLTSRKLYPRLANTEEDLYLHMSDYDYLGTFAEPATGVVHFNILYSNFKKVAYYDSVNEEYILKIPRNYRVKVDGYIFTLPAPIIIRESVKNLDPNETEGIIDVKLGTINVDDVYKYSTTYIKYDMYNVNVDERYIRFSITMPELDVESVQFPLETSNLFKGSVSFNPSRMFYFFKAFSWDSVTSTWKQMLVSHSDQVYDNDTPTCLIKISKRNKTINYYIPPSYIYSGLVTGKVMFHIYTTKGPINVNFTDYDLSNFSNDYNGASPAIDLDAWTRPLNLVNKVLFLTDSINDGKAEIPFEELKRDVINNSIGDRLLPITNKQLEYEALQNNFKLIPDIDTLTNRLYLLEASLPKNTSRFRLSKINMEIVEYKTRISDLIDVNQYPLRHHQAGYVAIPKGTLFLNEDNYIRMLNTFESTYAYNLSGINLVNELNTKNYYNTYYHYIIDYTKSNVVTRAYEIENPVMERTSFMEYNNTASATVTVISGNISKDTNNNNYIFKLQCSFKLYHGAISYTDINPILYFIDDRGGKFFLEHNGVIDTSTTDPDAKEGLIEFTFIIDTDWIIDSDDKIILNNFKAYNGDIVPINIGLNEGLNVMVTYSIPLPIDGYNPGPIDTILQGTYIGQNLNRYGVSTEKLFLNLGKPLKRLYTRTHIGVGDVEYKRYTTDITLKSKTTVYDVNNNIVYYPGQDVLDDYGNPVIEHYAGSVMLNEYGDPIPVDFKDLNMYINLLLCDFKLIRNTSAIVSDYMIDVRKYLNEKITKNAVKVNELMLENTESFVVVPKNLKTVTVKTAEGSYTLNPMQSFNVTVYVTNSVYTNEAIRNNIINSIIVKLDDYLYENTKLKRTEFLDIVYNELKNYVQTIELDKFTEVNEEYLELTDPNSRLSLNKLLYTTTDGYDIKDDVSVTFKLV